VRACPVASRWKEAKDSTAGPVIGRVVNASVRRVLGLSPLISTSIELEVKVGSPALRMRTPLQSRAILNRALAHPIASVVYY
jgi:hypothetical protein